MPLFSIRSDLIITDGDIRPVGPCECAVADQITLDTGCAGGDVRSRPKMPMRLSSPSSVGNRWNGRSGGQVSNPSIPLDALALPGCEVPPCNGKFASEVIGLTGRSRGSYCAVCNSARYPLTTPIWWGDLTGATRGYLPVPPPGRRHLPRPSSQRQSNVHTRVGSNAPTCRLASASPRGLLSNIQWPSPGAGVLAGEPQRLPCHQPARWNIR